MENDKFIFSVGTLRGTGQYYVLITAEINAHLEQIIIQPSRIWPFRFYVSSTTPIVPGQRIPDEVAVVHRRRDEDHRIFAAVAAEEVGHLAEVFHENPL